MQHKPWRDKAVLMMEQNSGSIVYWRRLDDIEYDEHIRIKIVEEVEEIVAAKTQDALKAEIADVYEGLDALMKLHSITKEDVHGIQMRKCIECGGFDGRVFVEVAEHPIGSYGEKHCPADPLKCKQRI